MLIVAAKHGVRSLTQIFDGLAGKFMLVISQMRSLTKPIFIFFIGLSLVLQLNSASVNPSFLGKSSMPVAVAETRQGLYKEYTVEIKENDPNLDKNVKTYKSAAETEENKTKYWAILGVLLAGSFIIPMVQYYWYVLTLIE